MEITEVNGVEPVYGRADEVLDTGDIGVVQNVGVLHRLRGVHILRIWNNVFVCLENSKDTWIGGCALSVRKLEKGTQLSVTL